MLVLLLLPAVFAGASAVTDHSLRPLTSLELKKHAFTPEPVNTSAIALRQLTPRGFADSRILGRQIEECPGGTAACGNAPEWCAELGYFCCSNPEFTCPDGTDCCGSGGHCTYPGGTCCGESGLSCPAGASCCGNGETCAEEGNSCCGKYQCSAAETCCGGDEGCANEGYSCCGSGQCSADEQCCSSATGGCAPKDATCCDGSHYCNEGFQCCKDPDGDLFCAEECVETLIVDRNDYGADDVFDEIFENMCRGISQSPGSDPTDPQALLLDWLAGDKAAAGANRRAAGCAGGGRIQCTLIFGPGWSCDEFPFASTAQGGADAAVICIPQSVNSAVGGKWGNFVKGRQGKQQFRIKLKNFDCSKVSSRKTLHKRASGILANTTDAVYFSGSTFGNYSQGNVAVIHPLGVPDEFTGSYQIDYQIAEGSLSSGSIIDDEGASYGDIDTASSGQKATGTVSIGTDGVGNLMLLGWAANTQVAFSVSTSLSSATISSAPTSVSVAASVIPSVSTSAGNRLRGCAVEQGIWRFMLSMWFLGMIMT